MAGKIGVADLPPELRQKLGLKVKRKASRGIKLNEIRGFAIRALAVMAHLTPAERARVLRHALKVNAV